MKIASVISSLEELAHPSLQESYDNAGLITGNSSAECTGILCALDATEEVIKDAIAKNCNLVVAHHPILFKGIKRISADNYAGRALITAIKNDIAIYAIHTNLDNVSHGVSERMASLIGLTNLKVLDPKPGFLKKLHTFIPDAGVEKVRDAIFQAGAGTIGKYSECSFLVQGAGTFKANAGAEPFVGKKGERHTESEQRLEVIFPAYLEKQVIAALKASHPYEEVAYDIVQLTNQHPGVGSGLIGELTEAVGEEEMLMKIKELFKLKFVKHSPLSALRSDAGRSSHSALRTEFHSALRSDAGRSPLSALRTEFHSALRTVSRVAVCGGAGSFLIPKALAAGADMFITADLKYHEFFDAEGRMLLVDIGHFESEQFTIDLLAEHLARKFPTFAVLKTAVNTNPVHYC